MTSILVVDDNLRLARALTTRLRAAGFEVLHADRGEAAVDIARCYRPAAIILDIRMPDIDGFEVCRRLRAFPELLGTPVIFLSANASREDRRQAECAGGNGFLAKPCPISDLLGVLHKWIERARPECTTTSRECSAPAPETRSLT